MSVSYNLCNLIVLCLIAGSNFKPTSSSARCGRAPQILDGKQGDITSSSYHNWSYRFGSIYDCWIIRGNEDEPIVLSFSQFSTRCKKEWVSLKSSSSGREPVVLCGPTLPDAIEFPGGNVTVMHHFLPHLFPVSSFLLTYSRDSAVCPLTSFECASGRCLPLSWRCNGRVECLGEGLGADERGCDGEEEEEEEEAEEEEEEEAKPPQGGGGGGGAERNATSTRRQPQTTVGRDEEDLWSQLMEKEGYDGREEYQPWAEPRPAPPPSGRQPNATRPPPSAAEDWPCGGVLQTFYGTFAPPFNRGAPMLCVWTVDPQDPRPLKLDLQQLELGPKDRLVIYNRQEGSGEVIKIVTSSSNYKSVQVESRTGLLSLSYHTMAGSPGRGFNATFRVGGYCPPWEQRCGGSAGGCFTREQRCDGRWDCPETGRDEAGCRGCGREQFACGGGAGQRTAVPSSGRMMGRPVCYPAGERCNYQLYCADGSDERDCTVCQPGTFHCDSDRCVFESWRCDGQVDCKDGTDELNCTVVLPRKVITAATVGSLVCGLLLVIAMACTCKLYSLRTREYSMFAPISRQEAELIQQQAPPSYGQLIAQGVIPPVEDFPTENPNEATSLSLRGILQLLRQDTAASPRRRRRPRFIRRAVRRLRRWGFLPRTPSRPAHAAGSASSGQPPQADGTSSSSSAVGAPPPASTTGVSLAVEAVNQPVPHKLGLLAQATPSSPALATSPAFPMFSPASAPSPPPPPYAPPAPDAAAARTPPCLATAPSSPSLASIFQSLGQRISLFRPSPSFSSSFSSSNSMPLSASPSFSTTSCSSSASDDEVLLIPLSEDAVSEDDVPMLT